MQRHFFIPHFLLFACSIDPSTLDSPHSISKPPPNHTNPPLSHTQQATPELRRRRTMRRGMRLAKIATAIERDTQCHLLSRCVA